MTDASTQVLNRLEIQELVNQYAHCLDSGDLQSFSELFLDSARIDIGKGFTGKPQMMATIAEASRSYAGTSPRHYLSNLVLDTLSNDRATGRCYLLFTQTIDRVLTPVMSGCYTFELIKHSDRWRIIRWQIHSDRRMT